MVASIVADRAIARAAAVTLPAAVAPPVNGANGRVKAGGGTEADGQALLVPLAAIVPGDNARRGWDRIDAALRQLAASIEAQGLLEPLVVRELFGGAGTAGTAGRVKSPVRQFELVAGFRRYTAAKFLGMTRVPVRVLTANDKDALVANLTENLARADLPEGDAIRVVAQLRETFGMGVRQIARSTGRSPAWISELLMVARSPEERGEVEAGRIGINTAVRLARLRGSAAGQVVRDQLMTKLAEGEQVLVSDVPRVEALTGTGKRKPRRLKARKGPLVDWERFAPQDGQEDGAPAPEPAFVRSGPALELTPYEASRSKSVRLDVRALVAQLEQVRAGQGEDRPLPPRVRDDLAAARDALVAFLRGE